MTEFKVQLDDKVVQMFGYDTIENYLKAYMNQIILKLSSQDALKDLENIQLENDERWMIAREGAWKEQGHKYQRNLSN
jgi:hypothetical protein